MDGIINVYKEKGFTSHDVVAKLRGMLRMKKIGHTGTLDPDAEGVLPVCLGSATRLCDLLTDKDKVYEAVLRLGMETDTQDLSGRVLAEKDVEITPGRVRELTEQFTGKIFQVPPMYSAVKVNGVRLYELARAGKEVERQAREVEIFGIKILRIDLPRVWMRVHCSKGTYIRTLCHDLGQAAGCGGCMEQLTRVRSGMFCVEDSLRLDQILALHKAGRLLPHILTVDRFFDGYPVWRVPSEQDRLVHNGNVIPAGVQKGRLRIYDSEGRFIGIYEKEAGKQVLRPWKMFYSGS